MAGAGSSDIAFGPQNVPQKMNLMAVFNQKDGQVNTHLYLTKNSDTEMKQNECKEVNRTNQKEQEMGGSSSEVSLHSQGDSGLEEIPRRKEDQLRMKTKGIASRFIGIVKSLFSNEQQKGEIYRALNWHEWLLIQGIGPKYCSCCHAEIVSFMGGIPLGCQHQPFPCIGTWNQH